MQQSAPYDSFIRYW